MPALQIKDCPTNVYERLRECAARENRSISQQTLTIIEEFLDMRPLPLYGTPPENDRTGRPPKPDYLARRKEVFERIDELPPLPVTDRLPRSDVLLREIREEAR